MTGSIPDDQGLLVLNVDETANDSDKTITVPPNARWKFLWGWIEFVTTATVGNRFVYAFIRDAADDEVWRALANASQAASLTEFYRILRGAVAIVEPNTNYHNLGFPLETFLPQGYDIRIFDVTAVDVAADDLVIQMMVMEWIEE